MVVKSNIFLLNEISNALLKKDLQRLEPLCVQAIEQFQNLSNWDCLLESIILYGKVLRVKSVYSGDKLLIIEAFDQFERGVGISDKVNNNNLKKDLILEYATTYIKDGQLQKAEELLKDNDCLTSCSDRVKVKWYNTNCLLKANQFEFNEALEFANKALSVAEKLGEKEPLNNSYRSVGMVYSRQHNFGKIPEIFNEVITISEEIGDVEGKMISYNNLAVYNASVSNYKTALDNFLASYQLANSIGFRPHSARCLVNIGAIFSQLGNLELAKTHFDRVLKNHVDVIGVNTKAVILINIGEIYIKQRDLEAATNTIQLCLDYSLQENYQEFISLSYHHLGEIELLSDHPEKALAFSLKAKDLFDQLGDVSGKEENLVILAKCHRINGELQKAIELASTGIALAEKFENHDCIAKGNDLLAEIYGESNQFEKAFHCQKMANNTHKKIFEQKTSRALLDLEIQYDMRVKEREIEMLKSTNKIQSQLLDKQKAFEQQNKLLLQANEELKQFTYAVSHDLREPIRMIESYTQILKNKYSDSWNDEQHEFFFYVTDGAVRMRLLLKDLLEYATLGGNVLNDRSDFQLIEVVESIEIDLSLKIQESNTTILPEKDVRLFTNKNLFRLVLQNLISNAIKFCKEGVDPIITINTETTDKKILISVEDNGIGIDEIYQDKIFRLFHRIHSKEKYKGTGIGLALCAKIVRMMDGEISVHSTQGEGAKFILEFPVTEMLKNKKAFFHSEFL